MGRKPRAWRPFARALSLWRPQIQFNRPFLPRFLWSPNPVSRKQRQPDAETGSIETLLSGEAEYSALA